MTSPTMTKIAKNNHWVIIAAILSFLFVSNSCSMQQKRAPGLLDIDIYCPVDQPQIFRTNHTTFLIIRSYTAELINNEFRVFYSIYDRSNSQDTLRFSRKHSIICNDILHDSSSDTSMVFLKQYNGWILTDITNYTDSIELNSKKIENPKKSLKGTRFVRIPTHGPQKRMIKKFIPKDYQ